MIKQKSLQRELSRWIILTALAFILLGGIIAGGVAFYQARELQDHTLIEIATLVNAGRLNYSATLHHEIEKDTIIINELGKKQHSPIVPLNTEDGLHTLELDESNWRVLIITQPITHRRFSIAQQTKQRDNIAMSSSLSVFFPIVLLVGMMLLMINMIINRQFRSLGQLARVMDKQDGMHPKALSEKSIPIEIAPFVHSINELLARVRHTIQKQQRFIADAAHELRTPLTALSLQVENLAKATNSDARDERQKHLQLGLDRFRGLVTQLLDLARLQNESSLAVQKISFNSVVKEVIADLFHLAEKSNIDLGMTKQDKDIFVNDQQGRLRQLIYNAINNAIHYSLSGGKVDVSLYNEKGKAVFIVEDNGIGIPEEELDQVMQPFYRVKESNRPGNGLGLAISQEIAQLLGGEISLKNRNSGGLCFRYEQIV